MKQCFFTQSSRIGNQTWQVAALILFFTLTSCTPIKQETANRYKITAFGTKKPQKISSKHTLLISQPAAMAGYQTEQMLYTNQPFQLQPFAHSSWISPPATMLLPLIVQSLEQSHYFHAIAADPDVYKTDYRLDSQLLALQQNFLTKPSMLELTAQAVLTRVNDGQVIASRLFVMQVPCPSDTPYGGVVAANIATKHLTQQLTRYIIHEVQQDD